ncbi:hypothetical protein DFP93_10199 [Aneurinibacillus soli]|uniref:Epimerase family protein n=1 Tax=Aneurinibacillus soli TaxID=1500254 RepID=A0A0U4WH85_9BACL|nr:TIGR01777 family oxidoreductase [Aneurinibacillus soli]PYE64075.1 hypothetical protein DFP93_10199 [Aneurinibacillus soli]BAU28024.1 Epimerase family protein [Aneurinibacillus soli]
MHIAIAGGSGFIGAHLVKNWRKQGNQVTVISRSCAKVRSELPLTDCVTWDELAAQPDRLDGVDAIVNMAGESIHSGRWTNERKQRILLSRVDTTQKIAALVEEMNRKPSVVINGSAIGVYGMSDEARFDEDSLAAGSDFLAHVSGQWEAEADRIPVERLVKIRTGVVLGVEGGAFPKMAEPYKLFAGGRIGSGRQWLSWIHIDDYVRLLDFCLHTQNVSGVVNATAPHPVTNDEFGRALGQALRRPHLIPVPAFVLKLLFGEMAELLLSGQHVAPTRALAAGFTFKYPSVKLAVQDLVSKM